MERKSPTTFLDSKLWGEIPILDVRSPGEYAKGHIPGALSFPLFSDEERAEVGTLYKQQSREAAYMRGLEIVGPKMAPMVKQAKEYAHNGQVRVHCWRGGMRSESVAELLEKSGLTVTVLEGGYKAFRQQILDTFSGQWKFIVLGGSTGSGKTDLLYQLREAGEQIVDLEDLANHKGSSFGGLGQEPQPSSEHFANLLYSSLMKCDPDRPIWIEDESINIGRVHLPDPFWEQKKRAQVIFVEVPKQERIDRLVADYGNQNPEEGLEAFERIKKRLGGQNLKQAQEALLQGDYATAADIALTYYDRAYQKAIEQRKSSQVHFINLEQVPAPERAQALTQVAYPNIYPI